MAKAYRVADQIARRVQAEPLVRGEPTDVAGAVRELDAVIGWCVRLDGSTHAAAGGSTYEVGGPAAGG